MKIKELELHTQNLLELKMFYTEVLELPLLEDSSDQFSVVAGETILTFHLSEEKHQYHFAFNIPNNKIDAAIQWLSSRVNLITSEDDNIIYFESWNAHSVYFEDPSGNILEFIARHNLHNQKQGTFSYSDILNISEIGLAAYDVLGMVNAFTSAFGVTTWRDPNEFFSTIGDENGLIIAVSKGRQWFMSELIAEYHPVKLIIESGQNHELSHEGYVFISI
jgi:catechol-2,3-dioxygenase